MPRFIIRNATIIDGTGRERYRADIRIEGDRIAEIGTLAKPDGHGDVEQIDAEGLVLSPGFIDAHTHDDNALLCDPAMTAKVSQGVTTVITGNCGVSLAPLIASSPPPPLDLLTAGDAGAFRYATFADYAAALDYAPSAVNAGLMVGHSTLRVATMDCLDRPANAAEISAMRMLLREALDAGAIGFSSGLFYAPSRAATSEELVDLLGELEGTGAVYTTHMRDEADEIDAALDESFNTARQANVPLIISHHKCMGKRNFGRSPETLSKIDRAALTQDVSMDVYPYDAGSTVLMPELLDKCDRIRLSWSKPYPERKGQYLADIATEWGVSHREAMDRLNPGGAIYYMMDQSDVDRIMQHPSAMIGSDGLPHDEFPHPRLWGTFPRVLGHHARDRGLFPLEQAIHRMTGLTARKFGLAGRGVIAPGAFADLVLFEPDTIIDRATFDDPTAPAEGIRAVIVNGQLALGPQGQTSARAGRVLRRQTSHAQANQLSDSRL